MEPEKADKGPQKPGPLWAEHLATDLHAYRISIDPEFTDSDSIIIKHFNSTITDGSHSGLPPDPTPEEIEAAEAAEQCDPNEVQAHNEDGEDPEDAAHALAMALLAADTLNRTFIELKSKNEEVRLRASYDLYGLVAKASRGKLTGLCAKC